MCISSLLMYSPGAGKAHPLHLLHAPFSFVLKSNTLVITAQLGAVIEGTDASSRLVSTLAF